mmetsp:Transcript_66394/g.105573  ORF Transcript_66394/g.105573 Transcript_66394/m.105573 type:complete len:91 (+) Transcript_66394:1-273(+)
MAALALNIIAYQYAEATKVSWLEYTGIVFTFVYQIVVFGDVPNALELSGVALILTASMLPLLEESWMHWRATRNYQLANQESDTDASELL